MLYPNKATKGTEVTNAKLNHELKMYASPASNMSATAKNKQFITPAKVRYAGPITSKHKINGIWNNAWKVNPFNVLITVKTT